MNRDDERVLNDELKTYLRVMGLPLPLAVWGTWATCAVSWKRDCALKIGATRAYEALESWIDQRMDGKLLRAEERQGSFEVQGSMIVDGRAQGVRTPKLVLVTASITPNGDNQARATVEAATKIGRFSIRGWQQREIQLCQAVTEEMVQQLSAPSRQAE